MKRIYCIGAVIGLIVLQHFQHYVANIRFENVKKSLQRSDIDVCHHPTVDDRAELTLQRINIKRSAIHELGLFTNASIPCGTIIYDAYALQPVRVLKNTPFEFSLWAITPPFARVNHHHVPSARVTFHRESHRWVLHALRDLSPGEEITADYLDRPYFAPPPYPQWDIHVPPAVGTTTSGCSGGGSDISDISGISHDQGIDDNSIDLLERMGRLIVIVSKWIVLPSALLLM